MIYLSRWIYAKCEFYVIISRKLFWSILDYFLNLVYNNNVINYILFLLLIDTFIIKVMSTFCKDKFNKLHLPHLPLIAGVTILIVLIVIKNDPIECREF